MSIDAAPTLSAEVNYPSMTVVDMVWPDQSNHHGTLFGGAGLSILDRQAFILGSKVLRGAVVTAAVSRLEFKAPAPAGYLVECESSVIRHGQRSVQVATRLTAENLLSAERVDCLSGEFVMVRQPGEVCVQELTTASTPMVAEAQDTQTSFIQDQATAMVAEIVFPGHANDRGILHGGPAMSWMTKAGFVAATRQVRQTMVIVASDRLDFKAPAYVGEVVEIWAKVCAVGRRSVQVKVDMWAEAPETGERRCCTSGRFVYAALKASA